MPTDKDKELANNIDQACIILNQAIKSAAEEDLYIQVTVTKKDNMGYPHPYVIVDLLKEI